MTCESSHPPLVSEAYYFFYNIVIQRLIDIQHQRYTLLLVTPPHPAVTNYRGPSSLRELLNA